MSPEELKRIIREAVEVPGIYLCTDSNHPDKFVIFHSTRGKLMALSPTNELLPDRFLPTVTITPLLVTVPTDEG